MSGIGGGTVTIYSDTEKREKKKKNKKKENKMLPSAEVGDSELSLLSFAFQLSEKIMASPVTSPVDSSSFSLTMTRFLEIILMKGCRSFLCCVYPLRRRLFLQNEQTKNVLLSLRDWLSIKNTVRILKCGMKSPTKKSNSINCTYSAPRVI